MPKIKVYRDGDFYVPVNKAKITDGYECPFSGRVYLKKKDYVKNLKFVRKNIHHEIQLNNRNKKIAELNAVRSFDEMIEWIERESKFMHTMFFYDNTFHHNKKLAEKALDNFSVKITNLSLYWSNSVSNSHSCPRNGVENWGGRPELPTGYPGWHGSISFIVSHDYPGFASDPFERLGIYTGTGGGGAGSEARYEVSIFADDWPGLAEWASFNLMINNSHQLNYHNRRGKGLS